MKIQIQRIARNSAEYNHHMIDTQLMEGTVKGKIQPGKELFVVFNRLGRGEWCTTKVINIEYKKDRMMLVHTRNSTYLVVKGWKE